MPVPGDDLASARAIPVRAGRISDLERIVDLLLESGLPVDDLAPGCDVQFLVAEEGNVLAGCAGIELAGRHALLRSVAVRTSYRGYGLGNRLVEAAEQLCRQRNVSDMYLLTLTAASYFARRGYSHLERAHAPQCIASTTEFSSICPASSAFMMKRL
jgi:amino-acid N-acetyltransferase